MSRKSLILCLLLLAVLALGTGVAVAVLYSGTGADRNDEFVQVADDSRYLLLPAVPSDAVLVSCMSDATFALPGMYGGLELDASFKGLRSVLSLHYSGELTALYVFGLGKTSSLDAVKAERMAESVRSQGFVAELVDCSSCLKNDSALYGQSILIVSESEILVKSAVRHLGRGISVLDAPGFASACLSASADDLLFVSNSHSGEILPSVFTRKYASYSGFISRLSDWIVLGFDSSDKRTVFSGKAVHDGGVDEYMTVLSSLTPAASSVSEVLPSYTAGVFTLPVSDLDQYGDAYDLYLDSRQSLQTSLARRKELTRKHGISPADLMRSIGIREVSKAFFRCGDKVESLLLLRTSSDDLNAVFKGTDVKSLKDYVPAVHAWPFKSFVSSVFGNLFALEDESCFTYMDGWLVIGSMALVGDYAEGRALEYTLEEYMANAGKEGLFLRSKAVFASYFSFTADAPLLSDVFRKSFISDFSPIFSGSEYCPAVLYVSNDRKTGTRIHAEFLKLELMKDKAPVFERDTVVYVPEGPFEVKNSGTGKQNKFYQNRYLSLCLSEDGKDLWGVPFKEPICGTAQNVDYFANGKLQIAFGAGSRIYLIDRLGRFVNGFPVDLGKDILIGPDVYDFNGVRKYNVMVLHKDNTVEMYNLKGLKPSSWKGIHPSETVKSLPSALKVGNSTFWVVRTSMQTLIYPFYGGEPLTVFTGEQMIRPDSEVTPADAASVNVICYDGKQRTVKLK